MATCSAIIARALRMARIVAIGDEPTDGEEDEAMIVLQAIYSRIADTALATSAEVYETDDYDAEEGDRVYCTQTVSLPTTIEDEDTGLTRRPKDLAAIQYLDENTSSTWRTYISDRGTWVRVDSLSDSDNAPLSDRNREGLSALVAVELAETFGKQVGPDTLMKARRFQAQLQPKNTDPVEFY